MGDYKAEVTYIDLFSGCGGISLGLKWAGLKEIAAIDFDPSAVKVYKANFPDNKHVYCEDLRFFTPEELASRTGLDHVDVIVGGPPCQGFSTVRQRDGSNTGKRLIEDDRRELYQEFLKYVSFFKPDIFIIENVPGIKSAAGGRFFNQVQNEARNLNYRVHSEVVKAWEYGVPQKRIRRLIIGTSVELGLFSSDLFVEKSHGEGSASKEKIVTLWEAIGDLPAISAGGGSDIQDYDTSLRERHLSEYSGRYIIDVLECDKSSKLFDHKARSHSARDLRDFSRLREGENSHQAIMRGEQMEFPYNRNSFKDRYTRQSKNGLSSTILAHLSKDGLMFIHPTQNRSFTVREAARIQGFPDTFMLPVSRTDQFRLIGNAVPPPVGEALGKGVTKWLELNRRKFELVDFGVRRENSLNALTKMVDSSQIMGVSGIPQEIFNEGWRSIHYLFPHLHPISALENGDVIIDNFGNSFNDPIFNDQLSIKTVYKRSGWPVDLVNFAKEAKRRYDLGIISEIEFYWVL
jgi:DNA (cytosine-5)-methyltransferase 1